MTDTKEEDVIGRFTPTIPEGCRLYMESSKWLRLPLLS